jgi:hypothetical protein
MFYAHDLSGGNTDLVILAAQDFAGEPVARIHLPVRVPLGFHGSWIADSWALLPRPTGYDHCYRTGASEELQMSLIVAKLFRATPV